MMSGYRKRHCDINNIISVQNAKVRCDSTQLDWILGLVYYNDIIMWMFVVRGPWEVDRKSMRR